MIPDNRTIGQMTYHTLRYLYREPEARMLLLAATSPTAIKKIIWDRMKPLLATDSETERFLKGISLCDFNAIYEWVQTNRTANTNW